MHEKNYSLDALNKFLDFAAKKGVLKSNTVQSRKMASNKVFAVLDEHEKIDLRNVNIDHAFELFQNKYQNEYKPKSLQVYLSRVRTAVLDFIRYVDNPAGFRPSTAQRTVNNNRSRQPNRNEKLTTNIKNDGFDKEYFEADELQPNGVIVPIPLRDNLIVKISNIPSDLTVAEANKLAGIIKAYAGTIEQ